MCRYSHFAGIDPSGIRNMKRYQITNNADPMTHATVTAELYETFRTKLDPKAASNHRKSKTMVFKRLVFHALHRNLGAANQKQTSTNRLSSAEIARIVDVA